MSAGSWFWSAGTLYVWLADSSDPSGHQMEAATRQDGVLIMGPNNNNNMLQPLTITFTGGTSGTPGTQIARINYVTIQNLMVERAYGHGIRFFGTAGPVVRNCVVTQTGTGQVDDGSFYNALQVTTASNALVQSNTVSYSGGHGNAIEVQRADGALVLGNQVTNWNHNGIDTKMSTDLTVQGNTSSGGSSGAAIYGESDETLLIEQNILYNNWNSILLVQSTTAQIYNNSIYDSGVGAGVVLGPNGNQATVVMTNNALNGTGTAVENDGTYALPQGSHNDWGINPRFSIAGQIYNVQAYETLLSNHSDIAVAPQWISPPTNFMLQSTSPCVDAGTYVASLSYLGSTPDLGAIESH
jgi:hypothetical protein